MPDPDTPRSLGKVLWLHGMFYALCAREVALLMRRGMGRYLTASWQGLLGR